MFRGQATPWILFWLIVAVAFVYESTQPVSRLRDDMPEEFVALPRSGGVANRTFEEHVARAYWQRAATIQWKYTRGSELPDNPPAEFRIEEKGFASPEAATLARLRYWRRLRELWASPTAWRETYGWNFQWFTGPVATAGGWVRGYVGSVIANSKAHAD